MYLLLLSVKVIKWCARNTISYGRAIALIANNVIDYKPLQLVLAVAITAIIVLLSLQVLSGAIAVLITEGNTNTRTCLFVPALRRID
jgi:hypothetical protein